MSEIFFNCYLLEELILSSFNTKNAANISKMFSDSSGFITLNLSNFNNNNANIYLDIGVLSIIFKIC